MTRTAARSSPQIPRRAGWLACLVWASTCAGAAAGDAWSTRFEKEVAPLIVRNCLGCHNASEAQGNLVLTTREGLLKGGDTAPRAIH